METIINENEKLLVLWISGDREVALRMVFMYARNAKHYSWWKEVRLLIWGPSANLLAHDEELQSYIPEIRDIGVDIIACKSCADRYAVSEILQGLSIEVKYMGEGLTEMLKTDWKVLSI